MSNKTTSLYCNYSTDWFRVEHIGLRDDRWHSQPTLKKRKLYWSIDAFKKQRRGNRIELLEQRRVQRRQAERAVLMGQLAALLLHLDTDELRSKVTQEFWTKSPVKEAANESTNRSNNAPWISKTKSVIDSNFNFYRQHYLPDWHERERQAKMAVHQVTTFFWIDKSIL